VLNSVRVAKRLIDLVGSSLGLAFTLPLYPLIACAIYVESPGQVFIRQVRAGRLRLPDGTPSPSNGVPRPRFQEFSMLKFRSMRPDAEKHTGPVLASKDDPRITRVGRFLRKTRLDELPQFINVLRGDMSLVGPRPERPPFVQQFKEHIPQYMLRHRVKSGITGWAQVNGWRGNTSIEKRIEYDLYYIENWSLLLDVKILILTLFRGFGQKHAY
jgi:lipopolysaccharide/colanic/teichoic acid biosynthesis glycosyltransferase